MKITQSLAAFALLFLVNACSESSNSTSPETEGINRDFPLGNAEFTKKETNNGITFDCNVYKSKDYVTLMANFSIANTEMNLAHQISTGSNAIHLIEAEGTGLFTSAISEMCDDLSEDKDMKTNCSQGSLNASQKLGNTTPLSENQINGLVKELSGVCENIYDDFEFIDGSGDGSNKATTCKATVDGNDLSISIEYPEMSASISITVEKDRVISTEIYTGLDTETLSKICKANQDDEENESVECLGSTITLVEANEDNITAQDILPIYEDQICKGLLEGSITMEDIWFDK